MAASALKIESNRANAQHSTGPVSPEGKEISSKNASKHNLTGGPALAPGEDESRYQAHCSLYYDEYRPQTVPEFELVNQLADASWRLKRVAEMEREILAAHPNPFLLPDNPMSAQLMRLTRYRNAIQRTYDRAYKELQALTEASQYRRDREMSSIRAEIKDEMRSAGLPLSAPEVQDQLDMEVAARLKQRKPELARTALAFLNRSRN